MNTIRAYLKGGQKKWPREEIVLGPEVVTGHKTI